MQTEKGRALEGPIRGAGIKRQARGRAMQEVDKGSSGGVFGGQWAPGPPLVHPQKKHVLLPLHRRQQYNA